MADLRTSFLGIKSPKDAAVLNTLQVVDNQLGVVTPNGEFWHRYNFDGYGETRTGGPWTVTQPDTFQTLGRIWPAASCISGSGIIPNRRTPCVKP